MGFKKYLNSYSGFSLPEVMIALGLLGAIALGVAKMMETSNKAAKNIENKDEISHMTREISDILASPNNCEETLRDKKTGNAVYFIKQVNKVTGQKVTVSRFIPVPSTTLNTKVVVDSMKIVNIDSNGTDGSQGVATLEINFRKPQGGQLGGKVIKKEINLNVNLCNKDYITATSFKEVTNQCIGAGKKLIEPPIEWPTGTWFGVCQDCTVAGYKKINFCQSEGVGGVDVGSISKLTCINMGGTFDDANQKCDLGDESVKTACKALGGVFDDTTSLCSIGEGAATLQSKLCAFEKKFLGETLQGGTTTFCVPNINVSGTGLVNLAHNKQDCTGLGGTVMSDSGNKNFCKFNKFATQSGCPAGWILYNGWRAYGSQYFQAQGASKTACHTCTTTDCTAPGVSFAQSAVASTCTVTNCKFPKWDCTREWWDTVKTNYNVTQVGCY